VIARARRALLAGTILLIAAALVAWSSVTPRGDRAWIPEQTRLPEASVDGHLVTVRNVRNFRFTARHQFVPRYEDKVYDLDKLNSVWYVLTPFSRTWEGMAHSFVSFGFADSQFVAISVEAQGEIGETYGGVTGLFKRFEIMYVVGTEPDLIGQRAVFSDDRVMLYPIRAKPEKIRALFLSMLARANDLRANPEFYNTLTNNCTSNVIEHVNAIAPKTIPAGIKTLLPGYSDDVAMRLGLIDTDLDLARAREKFRVNDRAKRYLYDPRFSLLIRDTK